MTAPPTTARRTTRPRSGTTSRTARRCAASAGLSTELRDVTEVEYRQLRLERVVLVGVWTGGTAVEAENSLAELARLAETAGSEVLDGLIQRRDKPDPATYIGSGKAAELRDIVLAHGADTVICDGELTPGQLRQLEGVVKVKVVDRTALILDIFAQHARSREGKAQVELAQLQYLMPRLRGWGESLSRQVGGRAAGGLGIGGRGPGETKIEIDRRRITSRMAKLRRELAGMKTAREVKRSSRRSRRGAQHRPRRLHQRRQVLAAEPAHRRRASWSRTRCSRPSIRPCAAARPRTAGRYTLADTVGFVRHLPTQLVEAFRSTLEEVAEADLLVHVVDASDADPEAQIQAVREVLADIDALDVPELLVFNKTDAVDDPDVLHRLRHLVPDAVFVSARTGEGVAALRARIEELLPRPAVEVEVRRARTPAAISSRGCTSGPRCSRASTSPRAPGCTPGSRTSSRRARAVRHRPGTAPESCC